MSSQQKKDEQSFSTKFIEFTNHELVKGKRRELAEFDFEPQPNNFQLKERIFKDEVTLKNGNQYSGEFYKKKRDGRGVQVMPDGSLYEGYFVKGKANGRGRLIAANGDVYEGNFLDDMSHGYGTFTAMDGGGKYEGDWIEDK